MATTRGRVVQLLLDGEFVCAWVGTSVSSATILFVRFRSTDGAFVLDSKRALVKALTTAFHAGSSVAVQDGASASEITQVDFEPPDIALSGPAIQGDLFAVTGQGFPADVQIVFQAGPLQVTVTPELRRPHWVLVASLPAAVPVGRCRMFLQGTGYHSDTIQISVSAGPKEHRRTLYSGRPVSGAYTVVFAATPGRLNEAGTNVVDGITSDRPAFNTHVAHCLRNILTVDESLLRTANRDRAMRFVAIFDAARAANTAGTLVKEDAPDILEPLRAVVGAFASAYWEAADIVYCISADLVHTRASAWFTTDSMAQTTGTYTYDGTQRRHGLRAATPGTIAQSTRMDTTGLTALHEFGHAASDFDNGQVDDLYVDTMRTAFVVNKKARAASTDPVPANFATVNTTTYAADAARDSIGYDAGWTSYHPALQVTNRPNLMDNFWNAGTNVLQCRLDGLTFDWFSTRLAAKISRPE